MVTADQWRSAQLQFISSDIVSRTKIMAVVPQEEAWVKEILTPSGRLKVYNHIVQKLTSFAIFEDHSVLIARAAEIEQIALRSCLGGVHYLRLVSAQITAHENEAEAPARGCQAAATRTGYASEAPTPQNGSESEELRTPESDESQERTSSKASESQQVIQRRVVEDPEATSCKDNESQEATSRKHSESEEDSPREDSAFEYATPRKGREPQDETSRRVSDKSPPSTTPQTVRIQGASASPRQPAVQNISPANCKR